MTHVFVGGLLALCLSVVPAFAQPPGCRGGSCATVPFNLTSVSDHARYGLLVRSPADTACPFMQFVVAAYGRVLARSVAMRPDQVQVVRIGAGFAAGDHALQITASGCPAQPAALRRVRLAKTSPDHGWRATALLQAGFAP